MPAKRLHIDGVTLQALTLLGMDERKTLQDLTDEAFADLLRKHRRPVGLQDALRHSLRRHPANTDRRKVRR
jgi:hypothetical protein